jgi:hypothetical protein
MKKCPKIVPPMAPPSFPIVEAADTVKLTRQPGTSEEYFIVVAIPPKMGLPRLVLVSLDSGRVWSPTCTFGTTRGASYWTKVECSYQEGVCHG